MANHHLTDYRIKKILPCIADETKIRAIVEFDDDLGEIMPYLNAVIPRGIYNHIERLLTFMEDGVMITLYPRQVTMAKAEDEAHVARLMHWLKELVNSTYEKRAQIEPSCEQRERLKAVDIYKLLPGAIDKKYCRQCGEVTCLVFAARLASEEVHITRCKLLFTKEFEEKRRMLLEILRAAGYCVPPDHMELETCEE
jgi:ArsR family metal-binding transcriptional regulator